MPDGFGAPQGGQRLIVPSRAGRLSGREIVIPRLAADPDQLPASPSPWDDEFDQPTLSSAWTVFGSGSGTSAKTSTVASHLTLTETNSGGGSHNWYGVVRPIPPMPFTAIGKITAWDGVCNAGTGSNWVAMVIGVASPGAFVTMGHFHFNSTTGPIFIPWTNSTTGGSAITSGPTSNGYGFNCPLWIKYVVTSSSNVSVYFSRDGILYTPYSTGYNTGLTIASIGFGINNATNVSATSSVHFDYIRFKVPS